MESLRSIRSRATASRTILDHICEEWTQRGAWPEAKVVHHRFGRAEVRRLFGKLNRAYAMEHQAGNETAYKLGMIGMISTSHGDRFLDLLQRFVAYWRELYLADPRHPKVTSGEAAKAMNLSMEDTALLGRLLSSDFMAGVLRMNGAPQPDSTWEYTAPTEIDEIGEKENSRLLLERLIARTNRPGESVFLDERVEEARRQHATLQEFGDDFPEMASIPQPGERRYQVFVSSTYEDLTKERQAVMLALLESKCIPAGMELFPAASIKQWELIKRVIDESDYYLVIVAGRYGSLPAKRKKRISYTELEFNYAASKRKPILGFYHVNPSKLSPKRREKTAIGRKRLEQFRAKIRSLPCGSWHTPAELGSAVKTAIAHAIEHDPQPGWVRAPSGSKAAPGVAKQPRRQANAASEMHTSSQSKDQHREQQTPEVSFPDGETEAGVTTILKLLVRADRQEETEDNLQNAIQQSLTMTNLFINFGLKESLFERDQVRMRHGVKLTPFGKQFAIAHKIA